MKTNKMIFLSVFIVNILYGQVSQNKYDISLSMKGGALFRADNYHTFLNHVATKIPYDVRTKKLSNGFSLGLGVEYLNLFKFYNSSINIAVEAAYGNINEKLLLPINVSEMNYEEVTTFLWLTLISNGIINPYFGVGIGAKQKWIKETQSYWIYENSNFKQLLFSLGLSTGIEYRIKENINIMLFVDLIYSYGGKKEILSNNVYYDFSKERGSIVTGISLSYSF